jgi:hypothetical protein
VADAIGTGRIICVHTHPLSAPTTGGWPAFDRRCGNPVDGFDLVPRGRSERNPV